MPKKIIMFLIVLIVSAFFALTFKGVVAGNLSNQEITAKYSSVGQTFETSQERVRYALAKNIVDEKILNLDNSVNISLPDVSYKDGHYYSVFPPGVSLLIAPIYALGRHFNFPIMAVFAVPPILAVISALLIFLICQQLKIGKTASFIAAICFPLATTAFPYSNTLYAHIFSVVCLLGGFYFALKAKKGSAFNHFMVWFLYGLSILIDLPNALIMLPVVIFMIINSWRSEVVEFKNKIFSVVTFKTAALYTIFPLIFLLIILALYNISTFGSWSDIAHNYRVTSLVQGVAHYQFMISGALDFKYAENGLYTLLISKSRGIIYFVPILLLSILGISNLYEKSKVSANVILTIILLNVLIYACFYDPWGGWSFGPRYLIMSMPFLSILLAGAYDKYKNRNIFIIVFAILLFLSFAISLLGVLTTNLLPPAAEVGREVGFLSLVPKLNNSQSSSYLFNLINHYREIDLRQYFVLIFGFFATIFTPLFLGQILTNILRFFARSKMSALKVGESEAV
jgi:hypothetical protein